MPMTPMVEPDEIRGIATREATPRFFENSLQISHTGSVSRANALKYFYSLLMPL